MPVPIVRADLFHKKQVGLDQLQILTNEICSIRAKETTTADTNPGCWRSSYRYNDLNWLLSEVFGLVDQAVQFYQEQDSVFTAASTPYKINYWTNVNSPGARNVLHSHLDSCFSCVYYIQATGTGDLRLLNPANLLGKANSHSAFSRDFYFDPTEGDLILWPSWVPHEVEPNLSNKDRINITFDITV